MYELFIYNPAKTQPGNCLLRRKFRSVESARNFFYNSEYTEFAYHIYDDYGAGVESN